jgi:hypothetical protein
VHVSGAVHIPLEKHAEEEFISIPKHEYTSQFFPEYPVLQVPLHAVPSNHMRE